MNRLLIALDLENADAGPDAAERITERLVDLGFATWPWHNGLWLVAGGPAYRTCHWVEQELGRLPGVGDDVAVIELDRGPSGPLSERDMAWLVSIWGEPTRPASANVLAGDGPRRHDGAGIG